MAFEHLFEPIKIGPIEIKNRIVQAPMNVHMSDGKGYVSDQEICFHYARAKGGVGLIVLACVLTSPFAAANQKMMILHLFDGTHARGMEELVNAVHSAGAKIFVQLSPGFGRQARAAWTNVRAPSPIPLNEKLMAENQPKELKAYIKFLPKGSHEIPRQMTIEEIVQEEDNLVKGARLAVVAGFDGIELHSCHGYLMYQFLSPRTNKRNDLYGGSFENRLRFLVSTLTKIRGEFGLDLPIAVRLSGAEHVDGGLTAEDTREIAKIAVQAGANCIDLSDGCYEAFKYISPAEDNVHILEEQGRKLRQVVKVPIISPSIHDPLLAEKAIAEGQTDMIGMSRQLLADPEWANKVNENRIGEIVRCRRDDFCMFCVMAEGAVHCTQNPNCGRERFMPKYQPQKIVSAVPETLKRIGLGKVTKGEAFW